MSLFTSIEEEGAMMHARRLDSAELAKLLTPDQLKEQLAFDALQDSINESYPRGHFVAVHNGRIIADAHGFDELAAILKATGVDPKKSVVMQAGRRVSNYVFIHSFTNT
jgi:hypothetical protein